MRKRTFNASVCRELPYAVTAVSALCVAGLIRDAAAHDGDSLATFRAMITPKRLIGIEPRKSLLSNRELL